MEFQLDSNRIDPLLIQSRIDYKSNLPYDYPTIDYNCNECDSSRQERSNNQEIDSIDSFDKLLELERDTINYENDIKDERLGVDARRLDAEQIMMYQLSKIIKILERTHSWWCKARVARCIGMDDWNKKPVILNHLLICKKIRFNIFGIRQVLGCDFCFFLKNEYINK